MSAAGANFHSPSLRRQVASLSIVALVVEDIWNLVNHLTGVPAELPRPVFIASMVLFACGCVAFLTWIWRAHKNLWELDVAGITVTPGWAVGWWFIPIANLFKPYLSMRELWSATRGPGEPSRGILGAGSALPLLWWLSFLLYNFYVEILRTVPWLDSTVRITTAASGVISAACILFMMRAVDGRQRALSAGASR